MNETDLPDDWDRAYSAALQDATNELLRLAYDTNCLVSLADAIAAIEALGGER